MYQTFNNKINAINFNLFVNVSKQITCMTKNVKKTYKDDSIYYS